LLGLIGTVIGMIITFKAITASGSSDPKLMAQGIGQAMIATVLGLGIAIPLLFINSGLAAMSRSITQILDEQSPSLLADRGSEAACHLIVSRSRRPFNDDRRLRTSEPRVRASRGDIVIKSPPLPGGRESS